MLSAYVCFYNPSINLGNTFLCVMNKNGKSLTKKKFSRFLPIILLWYLWLLLNSVLLYALSFILVNTGGN